MATLRVFLFGTLELRRDGEVLPKPPTQKSQSLLAYLITHRALRHPRHKLMGLFWGDRPERKARRSLATALWHIRRSLSTNAPDAPEYILTEGDTVCFNVETDYWLDVEEFESKMQDARCKMQDAGCRMQEAGGKGRADASCLLLLASCVQLYRGDFLAGFYDDWCISERYRLEALFLEALGWLIEAHQARGEYEAALTYAQRLLRHDPLREDVHRQVMRLYVRLGQPLAALRQFYRCQAILREELGIAPAPETTALCRDILDEHIKTEELPTISRRGRTPFDVGRGLLVGREQELGTLLGHWERCLEGRGRLVLVSGEAGVGKTRLAQALADSVRWRGGEVLWGRCYEHERSLAYQPIAEALRAHLCDKETGRQGDKEMSPPPPVSPSPSLPFSLSPVWLAEVARLIPELREHWPQIPLPAPLAPAQEQARLFEALTRCLQALSRRSPLLLVLEDLHWAAESTLQFLHYLTRHLPSARVLALGTFRPEEVGRQHPLRDLMRRLEREGLVVRMELERLAPAAVQELLGEMSGLGERVAPLARRLYQETEGNPFFLMEMVKALFEAGFLRLEGDVWRCDEQRLAVEKALPLPRSVGELIEARMGRLSERARQALDIAAVAGHEFDFEVLQLAWGKDEEEVLEAIEELLRRQLIGEGTGAAGREYEFNHHLIREVAYRRLHYRRRRRLHRLVGEATETVYRGQPEVAGELAHHFECAQVWSRALTFLLQAAEESSALYAYEEALDYYDRALKALAHLAKQRGAEAHQAQETAILVARAEIYHLLGRRQGRQADLDRLRALAEAAGDSGLLARSLEREARYLNMDGRYEEAIERARRAVALYREVGDASGRALALAQWGFAHYFRGEYEAAMERLQAALALQPEDEEALGEILSVLSYVYYLVADYERSLEYRERALAIRQEIGQVARAAEDLTDMGVLHGQLHRFSEAKRYLEQALRLARQIGSRPAESYALNNTGNLHYIMGEYQAALECYHASLDLQRATGSRRGEASCLNNIGMTLLQLGVYEGAEEALRKALAIDEEIGYRSGKVEALSHLARVFAAQGKESLAQEAATRSLALAEEIGDRAGQVMALNTLAHLHLKGFDDVGKALEYAREATQLAEEIGNLSGCIQGWAYQGLAHLALGDAQTAHRCTGEAVALLARCGSIEGPEEAIYFAHYRASLACGMADEADVYLRMAGDEVERKARGIADKALRRAFLESNREILSCVSVESAHSF